MRVLRKHVVRTTTDRFAVNSSVLTTVRMTNPVGNVKLDRRVTSEGFSWRIVDGPPAITGSNIAPRESNAPARKAFIIRSGHGSRPFAMPEYTSKVIVSSVG